MRTLYHWKPMPPLRQEALRELAAYPRVLQKILYNRGVTTRENCEVFLTRSGSLYDPLDKEKGLKDLPRAIRMILSAIDADEPIAVYGDYDVDGITASCILVGVLEKLGCRAPRSYIPDRFEEGYGLNNEALKYLAEQGYRLVITVDCGIRSTAEALYARELGLKMIISDHHEPGDEIPNADAVICARQPGDNYPEKTLCGAGIAYKIAEGLFTARPIQGCEAKDWIDIAALGTVADIVPLQGENRALVKAGLRRMRQFPRPAIQALSEKSGVQLDKISSQSIGYALGPRLNAPGRLDKAEMAFRLLMSKTLADAREIAEEIEQKNNERKNLTVVIRDKTAALIDPQTVPAFICNRDAEFNMGIVGLAAARLMDQYYRPAMIGSMGDTETRASCRSIDEFSIIDALDDIHERRPELLKKYGGHAKAAGLTVDNEHWDELCRELNTLAEKKFAGLELLPTKYYEMVIPAAYASLELVKLLEQLQPTGEKNEDPLFMTRNLKVQKAMTMGRDGSHLRVYFESEDGHVLEGVAFSQGDRCEELKSCSRVDVLYAPEANTYRDETRFQMKIKDMRESQQ